MQLLNGFIKTIVDWNDGMKLQLGAYAALRELAEFERSDVGLILKDAAQRQEEPFVLITLPREESSTGQIVYGKEGLEIRWSRDRDQQHQYLLSIKGREAFFAGVVRLGMIEEEIAHAKKGRALKETFPAGSRKLEVHDLIDATIVNPKEILKRLNDLAQVHCRRMAG